MARYYDRYSNFRYDGSMKPIPGLYIPTEATDKKIIYRVGDTRLDKVSNLYYNTPYCGWLIMLGNPQYGGLEFTIPDQSIIVIPFPFESAISRYQNEINKYNLLYGG